MKLICHPLNHYKLQSLLKRFILDKHTSPLLNLYKGSNHTIYNGISITLYKNIPLINRRLPELNYEQ